MKHLSLIAVFAAMACAAAFAPKAAAAEGTSITPFLDLRASLAVTHTRERSGDTAVFGKGTPGTYTNFDNGNFMLGNSQFGGKLKADKIVGEAHVYASGGLQEYWAEYDAGFAKFMIGQKDPMYTIWTNQAAYAWNGLGGYGVAWSGREKQFKVTIGGLYLDLMPANVTDEDVDAAYVQTLFPKTNIGYTANIGESMLNLGVVGNYNKIQAKRNKLVKTGDGGETDMSALKNKKIVSYMGYLTAKIVAGSLTVIASADYGVNEGNMNLGDYNGSTTFKKAFLFNGKYKNTTTYEGAIEAMYNLGAFSLGAGGGYVHSGNKNWNKVADGASDPKYAGKDMNLASCYIEGIIPVNQYITLYPEVSYFKTIKDATINKSGEQSIWTGVFINYYM